MRFWITRLVQALLTLFAVSVLAFLFTELAPGDYVDRVRLNPTISREAVQAMRARYGLDQPLIERYSSWVLDVARGSWGVSFAYGTKVAPLLWTRSLNTLLLGSSAMLLAWLMAVPAGLHWATRPAGRSLAWNVMTSVLLGVPELVLAMVLLFVAAGTGWFPIGGMSAVGARELSGSARAADLASHLLLPVVALALPSFAALARHVRSAIASELAQLHVSQARASGLRDHVVLLGYVLRPSANPLISLGGLWAASLLSGSFVVEVVMGWPGLGPFLLDAIQARDIPVVIGGVMCSAVIVVGSGLLSDSLLYAVDPRVREREG